MALYLLHFDPPYVSEQGKAAGHYLGWTKSLDTLPRRLREHKTSDARGSPLVRAAVRQGCRIVLARVWPEGTRTQERILKNRSHRPKLCPACCGEAAERRGNFG